MIEGVLIGIFGSSAYDLIKRLLKNTFGIENEELTKKVYNALDSASKTFFDRYTDEFGEPHSSFLAREENWKIVLKSTYYSASELSVSDFNLKGFEHSKDATIEAVEYFISCVKDEMQNDWFLDKILTEKTHQDTVIANQNKMSDTLNNILNENGSKQEKEIRLAHTDYPEGWLPEEGKPYTKYFDNGCKVNFVRQGNIIHLEQTLPGGGIVYYEVDPDGNVKDVDLPYPLKEYSLSIPDDLVLRKEERILPNRLVQTFVKLKWGAGTVRYISNPDGTLGLIDLQCRTQIRHEERLIIVSNQNFGNRS